MNLNNILTAADTTYAEAGDGQGFFAKASDVVTKGLPAAAVSGLVSLANTGIFYKNKIIGGDTEELQTAEILEQGSESLGAYYKENQAVLDTVGFVGASFIPGGAAVLGVRALSASRYAGSFKYLGFTAAKNQEAALRAGLQQIGTKGPSVFGSINANKVAALSWGTADNVLQAAAFETAAAVALYRSPTLKDEDLGDIVWDIAKMSLFGGAIGGAVEGLMVNKIYKNAGKAVESRLRKADVPTIRDGMGLGVGDEVFSTIESVVGLTKSIDSIADDPLKIGFRLNGRNLEETLNTGPLLRGAAKQTEEKALERVQGKLANIVPGDTSVGRVFAKNIVDKVKKGLEDGMTEDAIKQELGDVMWGLKRVEGLGSDTVDLGKETFYIMPGKQIGTREGLTGAITVTKPGAKAQAYVMEGNWDDVRIGTLGIDDAPGSVAEAWKQGFDTVLDPNKGEFVINPNSRLFRAINPKSQDDVVSRVYQPRTHTSMDDAVPYVADLATQGSKLQVLANGVVSGKRSFIFNEGSAWLGTEDALEATARHVWADAKVTSLKGQTIAWDDFSLLNKVIESPQVADETTMLKLADGSKIKLVDLTDFSGWVIEQKVKKAGELQSLDHRVITAVLGVEPQWVEKMTAVGADVSQLKADRALSFRPLNSFTERENLVLSYSKASMDAGPDFIDGMRAYQLRVSESVKRMDEAARSVVDADILESMPDVNQFAARTADSAGAGPGGFSFSNADYTDPLRGFAQAAGAWIQNAGQQVTSRVLETVQPSAARIIAKRDTELGAITAFFRSSDDAWAIDGNRLVDLDYKKAKDKLVRSGQPIPDNLQPKYVKELSDDTAEFIQNYHNWHKSKVEKENVLRTAAGFPARHDPDQLYLPPVDTRKVPYFALVKDADGRAFSQGGVSMITARDPKQLQELVAQVKQEFPHLQVHLKGDTEGYYKALGEYDYQSGLNSTTLDSMMRKKGILRDFQPVLEPTAVIDEYTNFVSRGVQQELRNVISSKNAQLFRELEWLSEQNTKFAESKMGYIGKLTGRQIEDPFGDYKRLALNISKRAEFPIWQAANEFVDAMGERAYKVAERTFGHASKGEISWEEANKAMEKVGLKGPFTGQEDFFNSQLKGSGNLFRTAVAKANSLLATVGLRLDAANAAVNILSSPILQASEVSAIRNSLKNDPELLAKFTGMMQVTSPDKSVTVPTIGKLWAGATASFFGPNKTELIKRYTNLGAIKGDVEQFHSMMESLALMPSMTDPGKLSKLVDDAVEKGAKFTGNNFAEQFTRFVSADMMRQITQPVVEAGRMSVREQDSMIRIFVNRTQGNYVASQRPIAFQGTIGAAVSLFQTYSFNFYQQLFRHIENRDVRTLAIMGGLQSGLFGLNGLPMFDAINTHLIGTASINEGHHDVYSTASRFAGKELGDWAMYGSLSAFPLFGDKAPALYTRGDLNPRHLTILPTSFADVPAVAVGTRILQTVKGFGQQASAGGDLGDAFVHALEHNGISRPLAGLAQVLQGEATTSKGALISVSSDMNFVASAARIAGARPMDEAVALNSKFRIEGYKAYDRERIETLGTVVKQKIRSGTLTEEDILDFAGEYASRGGRIQSYNDALKRWTRDSNQSVVNKLMETHTSQYGQRLMEIMGGDRLDDRLTQEAPEQ